MRTERPAQGFAGIRTGHTVKSLEGMRRDRAQGKRRALWEQGSVNCQFTEAAAAHRHSRKLTDHGQ